MRGRLPCCGKSPGPVHSIRPWRRFECRTATPGACWGTRNVTLGRPLVVLRRGQGSRLTPFGEDLLKADAAAAEVLARGLADKLKALNHETTAPAVLRGRAKPLLVHASHDFALAGLRDLLSAGTAGSGLELHFRGSLDSLADLGNGLCDVAGFHVPADPADDSAYDSYRPLLKARSLLLVRFVTRRQGLMVARGNPKKIRALADLAAGTVRFINRQQGSAPASTSSSCWPRIACVLTRSRGITTRNSRTPRSPPPLPAAWRTRVSA